MSSPSDNNKGGGSNPFDVFLNKKDDCDRPACEETVSALSNALNRLKEKKKKKSTISSGTVGEEKKMACPPSKDYIGKSSWTLLHSMVRRIRMMNDGIMMRCYG